MPVGVREGGHGLILACGQDQAKDAWASQDIPEPFDVKIATSRFHLN
ncbi:hypothetical protein NGB36_18375 [Streptomyces sp. RB6PN25]|uniref:Uncharacterized protein n=1 Tax=Streptomyces humicola TaxID=2953240 RepID=A0ABT1PXW3_9ACTN|nr:hypothetical protein [Streptomyces humicola]MCQ4082514.1 hypothetical protein [Streptomyces humicola]